MSGRSERGAFSQITGMRSGYLARIRRASADRFSNVDSFATLAIFYFLRSISRVYANNYYLLV